MCHAPVAPDIYAAIFVSDIEGVQVSTGTLTGVGIHSDVSSARVHLLSGYNPLLKPLYFTICLELLL